MNLLRFFGALFKSVPRVAARSCFERVRSGLAVLVDVRERQEWDDGVAERAALLPLTDLVGPRKHWQSFLAANKDRELLFYCAHGGRSSVAARVLAREGFRVANAGSFKEWSKAGWPVVQPRATGGQQPPHGA